jgi:hypothetical protein
MIKGIDLDAPTCHTRFRPHGNSSSHFNFSFSSASRAHRAHNRSFSTIAPSCPLYKTDCALVLYTMDNYDSRTVLTNSVPSKVTFVKIDIDEQPELAA